nr:hypothetical protein [Tanacetum cinerariifolium]
MPRKKFNVLAQHLQEIMEELLPKIVDDRVKELIKTHVPGENDAKSQKTSVHGNYVFEESLSSEENESEPDPSTLGNQEQLDNYDFWMDSYATDNDELLTDKESKKEILVSPHPQKPTLVVQSCQRDPKAPALSLVNQDLLYLKKRSLRPEKIMMSLHKFPAVIFSDDDIEERTSRWLDKYVKKVNPYARYNKVNRTAPTMTFLGIEKYKVFSIVSEPVYDIIYKNNKKERE